MDMHLGVITDAYALFSQFNIYVPQDDYDKVDSLQLSFNKMLENVNVYNITSTTYIILYNKTFSGQKSIRSIIK